MQLPKSLVDKARASRGHAAVDPSWMLDDQSFEKMGSLMDDNYGKLLGLYDELSMFLSQINVFRGRGLSDSHELALFLQLYGGNPWVRRTGMPMFTNLHWDQCIIILRSPCSLLLSPYCPQLWLYNPSSV